MTFSSSDLDRYMGIVPWQEVVTPLLSPAQVGQGVCSDLTAKHNVVSCVVGEVPGRSGNAGS